ncbi:TrmH family RNA methyltransferase [Candidatus Epulonipiscium viviparus]|uniref:TrmH family RNA methyltransferase n=1 Tax=Candidatus Epulonipiscium viviparus TaxID=420336 RepID=UPI00273808C1|nr:RNA methyltransferase [Candidatus Epulopiscium viviparus]
MEDKNITSITNPIIKNVKELQSKKSTRQKESLFVVEGTRAVHDLANTMEILYFIATQNIDKSDYNPKTQWITVSDNVYTHISDTKTPQGLMAIVKQRNKSLNDFTIKQNGTYLILEGIKDPGNLGTIVRTAYGLFVDAIFLTKDCVELYSPKVVRATMGAISKIDIIRNYEMTSYVDFFRENKVKIYATDLYQSNNLYTTKFDGSSAIVIGNEATGITEYTRAQADSTIKIPTRDNLESLNAAIATSIVLYEVARQKNFMNN